MKKNIYSEEIDKKIFNMFNVEREIKCLLWLWKNRKKVWKSVSEGQIEMIFYCLKDEFSEIKNYILKYEIDTWNDCIEVDTVNTYVLYDYKYIGTNVGFCKALYEHISYDEYKNYKGVVHAEEVLLRLIELAPLWIKEKFEGEGKEEKEELAVFIDAYLEKRGKEFSSIKEKEREKNEGNF